MNADEILKDFEEKVNNYNGSVIIDKGMRGAIVGTLEKACGGRKENRHRLLKFLTGKTSSKELHDMHWGALYSLVLPWKPEGGHWQSGNPELESVCNIILNADVAQAGQSQMFEYPEFEALRTEQEFKEGFLNSPADWEAHVESPKVQDDSDTEIPF